MYNNPFSTNSIKTLKYLVTGLSVALALVSVVAVISVIKLRDTPKVTDETIDVPTVAHVAVAGGKAKPQTVTVHPGSAVEFKNDDAMAHQIESDPYPAADTYPGLNAASPVAPGQAHVVIMDKVGTFTYHDKLNPSITGAIVVSE